MLWQTKIAKPRFGVEVVKRRKILQPNCVEARSRRPRSPLLGGFDHVIIGPVSPQNPQSLFSTPLFALHCIVLL